MKAVFKILKDWRHCHDDFKIAYEKLCATLRHDEVIKDFYGNFLFIVTTDYFCER